MIKLPTVDGDIYINPNRVAAIMPYMKHTDKCKVVFSEEKGNFLVVNESAENVAELFIEAMRASRARIVN